MRAIAACLLSIVLGACVGANPAFVPPSTGTATDLSQSPDLPSSPPDEGVADDLSVPPDLRMSATDMAGTTGTGLSCGPMTCEKGLRCCGTLPDMGTPKLSCAATCPPGGISSGCTGPESCGGTRPYCCAKVVIGPGSLPNCPILSLISDCADSCTTNLGLTCPMNATVRTCHAKADCATDTGGKNCCEFQQGAGGVTLCVNALYAAGAVRCL